jgi:hypothetical protein
MNYVAKKQMAEKIDNENQKLMSRIMTKSPTVSKKQ